MDESVRHAVDRMDAMRRDEEGAVRYWDGVRRDQMGAVNQALMGVALAAVVLVPQLLGNAPFLTNRLALSMVLAGIGLLALSLLFGIIVALVRLHDFRGTAKLARDKGRGAVSPKEAEARREKLQGIGDWTWRALYAQVGTASLGFLLLVVALLMGTWVAANAVNATR